MRSILLRSITLAVSLIVLGGSAPESCGQDSKELCSCGPDYCLGDPRYPAALQAKKQRLRAAGFSADLIALLDRDGNCVAAVEQGPDTFLIKRKINGAWDTRELNAEREGYARSDLMSGATDAYYKFNTNRALACCEQPRYDQRPDWDANLDLNLSLAIVCRKSGGSVVCKNAN